MDVKCAGCNETTTIFSHAQTIVACSNCKNVLTKPTGGKCKIAEGNAFKVKSMIWMSVYFVCNLPNIKMNMSMGMKIINFDM